MDATAYRIEETGQRVNAVELELHLQFGLWRVRERDAERWLVRTRDGETLTLRPVG
ncbi:hypothetical protein NDI56_07330 [Haloarcula sp. S1CR25-12]|uniref:Uncharacterized protein n=1 Tax=Haloarcula saliterrae TaxID=2950534 RepID=A0ABU2FA89_9EURY|nr:hypothetical protein [Haloarcula sp. S1CR25-12]MDS0259202.1 hypothetical protein [Haloarcula sp. S1CR25-12]